MFIAEGSKLVLDLLSGHFAVHELFVIYAKTDDIRAKLYGSKAMITEVTEAEMSRITALSSPSPVLAVMEMAKTTSPPVVSPDKLVLALDDIRDPGNMGTIIRVADWFGISTVICSETCVDLYNPKVVQATMGSVARVRVISTDLPAWLSGLPAGIRIYGTFAEGENMYEKDLQQSGIIIIGNEAKGISAAVADFVTDKIAIPAFPVSGSGHAESLNASVATAVICAEFRRRSLPGKDKS